MNFSFSTLHGPNPKSSKKRGLRIDGRKKGRGKKDQRERERMGGRREKDQRERERERERKMGGRAPHS